MHCHILRQGLFRADVLRFILTFAKDKVCHPQTAVVLISSDRPSSSMYVPLAAIGYSVAQVVL